MQDLFHHGDNDVFSRKTPQSWTPVYTDSKGCRL